MANALNETEEMNTKDLYISFCVNFISKGKKVYRLQFTLKYIKNKMDTDVCVCIHMYMYIHALMHI